MINNMHVKAYQMHSLPRVVIGIFILLFLVLPRSAEAVTIASQTQNFGDQLNVWQTIQELGNNLSGTLTSFTFRVSTSRTNLNQFDSTAVNSKIYDKDNSNFVVYTCTPDGSSSDPIAGLTFNTTNVPAGYEDVTLDFSCRNYNFIQGHKYLIKISNANIGNSGSGVILFTAVSYNNKPNTDYFPDGGLRYANGNTYDYSNNSGSCDPTVYTWNGTDPWHNGCYVWTAAKDDLYFVLNNNAPPPPPPKLPVVFIPGIGGSELKTSQDIVWSKDDGHGGTFSHAYPTNEKIWVNQDEAAKLGDDDYFDILRLKADGVTPEASLGLTGNMNPYGYSEIDSFFTGMGYVKENNFFVFNYDWRKDVREAKNNLDALIESAKTISGQSKVNLVVHSLGGLIARFYISDPNKAAKVNKLIELGVPHLGATSAIKTLMYGILLGRPLIGDFGIGVAASEVHDVSQNSPSVFALLPSSQYSNFYKNSTDLPYPFRDDRDIDNNKTTGALTYDQTKNLLSNLSYNMTVFNLAEQFHNFIDPILNQTNGTKIYEIVGTAQPTLGQIHETWWITWPINLLPKTDEIYINGDDTVPLYSASLKSDSLDISGATKIYYVEQRHGEMPKSSGISMQTVKSLLNDDNALPSEVKDQKISLEGEQLSLDDGELNLYDGTNKHCGLNDKGEIEENIPDVTCTTSSNTKHAFVKKKSAKLQVRVTRKNPSNSSKTTNIKKRTYKQDKISKTTVYKDIFIPAVGKIEFTLNPSLDTSSILALYPDSTKTDNTTFSLTSEVSGDTATDQNAPSTKIDISGTKDSSGIYSGPVTITLTGSDLNSGILRIEYSLDNGITVQTYANPFTVSTPGKTTIQVKAIDKVGNEENPQTITIEIAALPAPTPTPASTSTSATSQSTSVPSSVIARSEGTKQSSESISHQDNILGANFENPGHISDRINIEKVLEKPKQTGYSSKEILKGLLIVAASIFSLASVGLFLTFYNPFPNKM